MERCPTTSTVPTRCRSWRPKIGVDEVGLLRTVDRFNPEAAQARDPQFNRGDTLFDRYFGAFYPRLGKYSPDARFPAATAKARMRDRRGDRSRS